MSSNAITRFRKLSENLERLRIALTPWFRVIIRLLALPYWYLFKVDRSICRIGNWQIFKDFVYIVCVLRSFPGTYYPTRLWEMDRSEWAFYYGSILDPFQRAALLREVSQYEYHVLAKDKEVTLRVCEAFDLPHVTTLAILDQVDNYKAELLKLLKLNNHHKLLIKPALGSCGENIKLIFLKENQVWVRESEEVYPLEELIINQRYLVQPFLEQHDDLNTLFPHAVNTIRAITIFDKKRNRSLLLGAKLRTGTRKTYTDNMHRGGISIGIDPTTGRLTNRAMDYEARFYVDHPYSGIPLLGFQIPYWNESVNLILETQTKIKKLGFIGHDIAITAQGPCIIELNHQPCMMGFEQAYGPIFKNKASWEFFRDHDLLINQPSRNLYQS